MVDIGLVEELNDIVKWNTTIWGEREREGERERKRERYHTAKIFRNQGKIYNIYYLDH